MDFRNVVDRGAVAFIRSDQNLPGTPEQVEIVHVNGSKRGLQRVEKIRQRDAQRIKSVAVDIQMQLRTVRREGGVDV